MIRSQPTSTTIHKTPLPRYIYKYMYDSVAAHHDNSHDPTPTLRMPWECGASTRTVHFHPRPEAGRSPVRGLAAPLGHERWGEMLDLHHSKRVFKAAVDLPPLTTSATMRLLQPAAGLRRSPSWLDVWGGSSLTTGPRVLLGRPTEEWGDGSACWANGGVRTATRSYEGMNDLPPPPKTPWAKRYVTESQAYGQTWSLPRAQSAHHLRTPVNQAPPLATAAMRS